MSSGRERPGPLGGAPRPAAIPAPVVDPRRRPRRRRTPSPRRQVAPGGAVQTRPWGSRRRSGSRPGHRCRKRCSESRPGTRPRRPRYSAAACPGGPAAAGSNRPPRRWKAGESEDSDAHGRPLPRWAEGRESTSSPRRDRGRGFYAALFRPDPDAGRETLALTRICAFGSIRALRASAARAPRATSGPQVSLCSKRSASSAATPTAVWRRRCAVIWRRSLGQAQVTRFADGEVYVEIQENSAA